MKKKFIIDVGLNIVSAAFPLFVLQLIALPLVASKFGSEQYGIVIALISALTLISFPMGNVLNNTRLLKNEKYKDNEINGDFNILLLVGGGLSFIAIVIVTHFIDPSPSFVTYLLLSVMAILTLLKDYLVVGFRLELKYKSILISNIYLGLGYFIGTVLFALTNIWQLIYLSGLVLNTIFLLKNLSLHKEPILKTKFMKDTFSTAAMLYVSSLMKNITIHADKLLLLPFLGPTSVAVYYSSTILGKTISMVVSPLNSVILSYLVKKNTIKITDILKIIIGITITGSVGYFITIGVSPYFFSIFYSNWAEESLRIVFITTGAIVIQMMSSVIQPFNLRFNEPKWQVYINGLYLLIYLPTTISLVKGYGLLGFSWGVLAVAIFGLILQVSVLMINIKSAHASKNVN
ncbi:hypothetical protein SAMN04488126_102265 [Bhargavaea beijingensis]|uniref:Membrane protein involved in the export of O-antigen and teichoic acid n=1 Tax=Bhargavaea beijingensis TaxID=426756 RepID=A0A1G6ZBF6_9BACL|nr:hypothetical protein [Bhargavaea beijingensis]SDD99633.1 hypothetical protein SAMN04488126_102265 [Bhargavaea beijingensis]